MRVPCGPWLIARLGSWKEEKGETRGKDSEEGNKESENKRKRLKTSESAKEKRNIVTTVQEENIKPTYHSSSSLPSTISCPLHPPLLPPCLLSSSKALRSVAFTPADNSRMAPHGCRTCTVRRSDPGCSDPGSGNRSTYRRVW